MVEPLLVAVGGSLGAAARYEVGGRLRGRRLPLGTLAVNVLGSFVSAFVAFGFTGAAVAFVAAGFCGAFTTYSSFSFETVELWRDGERGFAALNAASNAVLSVAAVALAYLAV